MISKIFGKKEQLEFAELSGDYNPMHIDPLIARRLLFGGQVVHGVHTALWALDRYFASADRCVAIRFLKVSFSKPTLVNSEAVLKIEQNINSEVMLKVFVGSVLVVEIILKYDFFDKLSSHTIKNKPPKKSAADIVEIERLEGQNGVFKIFYDELLAAKLFPDLVKKVSSGILSTILCSSYLVGMKCPGLDSVYSELEITCTNNDNSDDYSYQVIKFDDRFGLVFIESNSIGFHSKIKAFRRPPIINQNSFIEVKKHIQNNEFQNQRALVIGGTRGLGEVAVKLLAAGGANVKFTYYKGQEDASRIIRDINKDGKKVACEYYDVLDEVSWFSSSLFADWSPTHLYYFPTPFIFSGADGVFSSELFTKFCSYYISGFFKIFQKLNRDFGLRHALYPSSIALNEMPKGMAEYIAAKSAGESLCEYVMKYNKNVYIHIPRLPRLATDQTSSLMPVKNLDPIPLIIEELRVLRDGPNN